ncbi:MAG: macro domain-containing protein [Hahellaceae bacterium]|nr:macro domain-containing protein [Hahellaceae bacterium]MCP5170563.1 macro domain-containing protein [Hahellaceae bacterium]
MANIEITQGDITGLSVDALVCPAHKHLTRGRGLSDQVFDQAGPELVDACSSALDCPVGEARMTPGFHLPARWIIHTVTPLWTGGDQWAGSEAGTLRHCYESVLNLAKQQGLKSIAFPALGAGTNKTPHNLAAHIGLEMLHAYAASFERLIICLRSDEALSIWKETQRAFYQ